MRRLPNWPGNILLLTATIVVFFGGVELLLRVTGIEKGRPMPVPIYRKNDDPRISYELKPSMKAKALRSTITTDRRGFRSPEPDPAKKTIAFLGDSIAFGYGVEDFETVPARLHASLDGRYNVLNAAVPGYNLKQEAATYETKIRDLRPGALVLVFYFNDLQYLEPAVLDPSGNIQPPGTPPWRPTCNPVETGVLGLIPGRCWLDLHSAFYRATKKFVNARQERRVLKTQETALQSTGFVDSVKEENLRAYGRQLRAFSATLPTDLPRLFVIWPEKELHFVTRPQIRALAEESGFRVLDLYEVFGNRPESLRWDTVHPSSKTAAEAAEVIRAAMEHHRLLP